MMFKVCSNIAVNCDSGTLAISLSCPKECLCQYGFYYTPCARHIKRKHGKTTDRDEEIRKQLELTHGITDLSVRDH